MRSWPLKRVSRWHALQSLSLSRLRGSSVQKKIGECGPVTVTHPAAKRYFMSISEAPQLVI
jgi:hypothetical protein